MLTKAMDKEEYTPKNTKVGILSVKNAFSEEELVDGKDPIMTTCRMVKRKNYFFKMGMYQQKLITHLEENPDWILPDYRRNEILGFLKQPLNDLCISRPKSRLSWGIPSICDEYVTYVC